jgi:hypothetical protein
MNVNEGRFLRKKIMGLPQSKIFSFPGRRDWMAAAAVALLGALLGLLINWASPRGFDMRTAAASETVGP